MSKDTLDDDIPKIILDKEDREAFQRTRQQSTGKVKPGKPEPEDKPTKGSSSLTVTFLFLVAFGALGASIWLYQLSVQQTKALQMAETRITDLEQRLSATGEEMGQSAVAMQVKVKELVDKTNELWNQMDKLWASAWRRNQADIEKLGKGLTEQKEQASRQLSVVETEVNQLTTNLAVLQEQVNGMFLTQQAITDKQVSFDKDRTIFNRQISDLQSQLQGAEQVNASLARRLAELEKWQRAQASKPVVQSPPATQPSSTGSP